MPSGILVAHLNGSGVTAPPATGAHVNPKFPLFALKLPCSALLVSLALAVLSSTTAEAQWYPRPYPYPYPYPYYPVYARPESAVRVLVTPKNAEVYVDGYYAGIVDDFNGVFQRLHAPPGPHEITLHLEGYRTVTQKLYLAVNSTYKLRHTMEQLAAGARSEPPPPPAAAPPGSAGAPMPPTGPRWRMPPGGRMPPPPPAGPGQAPGDTVGQPSNSGSVVVRVQPAGAQILIDGEHWTAPGGEERLVIQLAEGTHHVEIQMDGYRPFSGDIQIRRGDSTSLNVSLTR
jgi:hypothetical protein